MSKDRLNLVEVIKANPGCVAIIDNDYWTLHREHPYECCPSEDVDQDAHDEWQKQNEIARCDNIQPLGDGGYGSGNCYGGDILQALAQIVSIKIESV